MDVSKRIVSFQSSPIRKLVGFGRKREEEGVHVIHLNIGQPDILTPKSALDAIKKYDKDVIAYGLSEGEVELRSALKKYYKDFSVNVDEKDMLITTGGSEALLFVLIALCDAGEEVIVPEPYYTNVGTFAKTAGVVLKAVEQKLEDNFALPPLSSFEKMITSKTRAILLCSPNNPTGHIYTKEELLNILKLCKERDLFLVSDEVYREFCYDGKTFTSVLTFEEYKDRVICTDSFSKRFSLCGARVGAIVSKNEEVIKQIMKLCQARLCPPMLGQEVALAALSAPPSYIENVKKMYEGRRNSLIERMKKIPGVKCSLPAGAFYFIAELPVDDAEEFALFMIRDFSYNGSTVMFAPAAGFYVTPGLGKKEARFAYVIEEPELLKAADCIEKGLEEYRKKVMGV